MKKISAISIIVSMLLVIFGTLGSASPRIALAATTPSLGTAASYGVVSTTFTSNVGQTTVTGAVGYTTLSGSGTIAVSGTTSVPSPAQVGTDIGLALTNLNAQSCTTLGTNVVLAGTYTPGCYSSTGTMDIVLGTTVTLSGSGTYIFRSGGAITTGANSVVALANGASSCDVFWTPNGATTLGANSTFIGTDIPVAQDITVGNLVTWIGRALTYGHVVTTDTDIINSTCVTINSTASNNSITVLKQVINDNGGTATFQDFPLFVNGTRVASGQSISFVPGIYTVTETNLPNYKATFSGDCNANGQITHGGVNTRNNICIITNDDIAPTVAVPITVVVPPVAQVQTTPVIVETTPIVVNTPIIVKTIVPGLPATGYPPQNTTFFSWIKNIYLHFFAF